MIRLRSTGSHKDTLNAERDNSTPLRSGRNNRTNNYGSRMRDRDSPLPPNCPADDDDLRSLLSGASSSEVANPHRHHQHLQQQQQGGGHITHLSSLSEDNATGVMARTNSSASISSSNNNKISHKNSKRALWVIGIVILAVVCMHPSGLLWDLLGRTPAGGIHHGDKHHHLAPPPPPHYQAIHNVENVSPMLRNGAPRAMESATATQGRHDRFGDRQHKNKRKQRRDKHKNRNKNKNKGGGGGWGIKEAVENLDKLFLEKGPWTATGVSKENAYDGQDDEFLTDDAPMMEREPNALPVVHSAASNPNAQARLDANVDALDAYTNTQLPASDALECRASVVAFVINATDVRDECNGLRRAFDKTCSVAHAPAPAQRRRLSERGRPRWWNLMLGAHLREPIGTGRETVTERIVRQGRRLLGVVGHQGDGIYETKRHAGTTQTGGQDAHAQSTRSLQDIRSDPAEGSTGGHTMNEERKMEEEGEKVVSSVAEEQQQQPPQKPIEQHQPLISLNIPTIDKHISQDMLNDALLLQESDSDSIHIKAAPMTSVDAQMPDNVQEEEERREEAPDGAFDHDAPHVFHHYDHPQPSQGVLTNHSMPPPPPQGVVIPNKNITAASAVAVQDAAESASAIRTAVETVKNSMSDAKSIEARTCCASILSVFHEHCDPTTTGVEDYSDRRLLIVVLVITVCGIVKSLIRHLNIRWLPEAGGCILVGVFGYLVLEHMPHVKFAFDGDMFLRIMVPPIVFEAAVKINKSSFRRHIVPICIFAIVGTLASTAFTALILHKGTIWMGHYVVTIPLRESFIFGALISSIDPIAVLSILNSMGMTDSDAIYVLIFGEALLNDGVAIVLFQTLVHFLDESLVVDGDVVVDAFVHFVVVALGSVTVGILAGACATVYFSLMRGCQTPMVEVIMFCCWSFIPYYICDMVEWSGIVSIVANGFVMDLYVIGQKSTHGHRVEDEIDFLVNGGARGNNNRMGHHRHHPCRGIFNYEGYLSPKAESHVHFVIEIFATLMETAIFAYLGLFLFSDRYHWSLYLTLISIFATVMGRILMIPLFSQVSNILNRANLSRHRRSSNASSLPSNSNKDIAIDGRMQLVLIFAGLRGAMSFALVEHIPMYDTTTGQGSRLKPELKAMTSASVIFTVFVLGGATSYLMESLGYTVNKQQTPQDDELEITLMTQQEKRRSQSVQRNDNSFPLATNTNHSSVRQRGSSNGKIASSGSLHM